MTDEPSPTLHATIHPTGKWREPCDVRCACGFEQRVRNCGEAAALAHRHDKEHHWKRKDPLRNPELTAPHRPCAVKWCTAYAREQSEYCVIHDRLRQTGKLTLFESLPLWNWVMGNRR